MNELSIIVPVLSHFEKMSWFMDNLARYLMANPGDADIIVVVDQTIPNPESLIEYAKKNHPWLKFRVLQRMGMGSIRNYGALVRFGLAYSSSKYVVLVSSHGEDDLSLIAPMLAKIRKDNQVVQVTRYSNMEDAKSVSLIFRLYQMIYRILLRIFVGLKISDSTYGYKMFDRVFVQALGISRNGFSLCPEITLKSLLAGGKVDYIPLKVKPVDGIDDFRLFKDGLGYLLLVVRGCMHRLGMLWF